MNTRLTRWLLAVLLLITETAIHAQTHSAEGNTPAESPPQSRTDSLPAKRSFFKKFLDYFNDANKQYFVNN